jgi:competence ComEA-like helix-hairpin-helix protein
MPCGVRQKLTKSRKSSLTFSERVRYLGLVFAQREQSVLAVLILVSLIGIGVWGWRHSVRVNQMIDIDHRAERAAKFQIDLNKATWQEISALPGIGRRLAKEIVDYRDQVGSFSSNEAIQSVSGIGPQTFEQIAPFLQPNSGDRSPALSTPRTASKN